MDHQQFLDEKMHQLRVVCQSQWDYLKYADLEKWLTDNFQNDIEGRYYATKIILHTVYYTKKDLENLLNYGLNEKIYGVIIKECLVDNKNIYIANSDGEARVADLKRKSFFVPLLDSNKPHESGNGIIGDLVHKLDVKENQVAFHRDITEELLDGYKILIFADDCIGSGNQLKKFWNSEDIKVIREICTRKNIAVYYLVLLGYEENVKRLLASGKISDLNVVVCDLLTDRNRVFSEANIIWDKNTNELNLAKDFFTKVRKEKGASFLGYKNLDFAVILHDRLPNWSLPIFWKKSSNWSILLKRKTSNTV